MKLLIVLFLGVAPLALAHNYQTSVYDNLIGGRIVYADPPPINCTVAGATCSKDKNKCGTVYICIPAGGTEWTIVESDCPEDLTCNQGKCSATPSLLCGNNKEFKCKSLVGMYPDPADCRKFHFCLPNEETPNSLIAKPKSTPAQCPSGFSYNPRSTYCDRVLQGENCPVPSEVGTCENIGDTGIVKSNPTLYHICSNYDNTDKSLYPHLYMCPNGKTYRANYTCS